ncbi:MAG TPA: fluoride efflux transporter CrcB [Gemmatimonadaceae bacterium]|nr:fluoride efflux transporter CrcB [Gemmatimonadaceae bacterium]
MIWFVALGSALGGVARFLLSTFLQQKAGAAFPIGTLVVNISGSILLGFLLRYALSTTAITPEVRGLLTTGFCGGYTTFSTFTYETMTLVEDGEMGRAAAYIALSVAVSLIGAYLGIAAARQLVALREGT